MLRMVREDGTVLDMGSLSDQVYSMEDEEGWQYHWSVTAALQLGKQHDRLRVFSLSDADITPERILSQYPDLDEVYALNTDISRPLLFVMFKGKDQLIDGWHRLYKAALMGVDDLLAYFLTQEQADLCLVCKLPPGEGWDWGQPPHKEQLHNP